MRGGIVLLFNSLSFAVFLPIVFGLYWLTPGKFRWAILLISSYIFYMCWNVKFIALVLFVTGISYGCALLLQKSEKVSVRKLYLTATVLVCIGVLFVFKYFNFFADSFVSMMQLFGLSVSPIALKLLLPVGISFYTFQALGYVIDVYRGKIQAQRHLGKYAAFVAFFPQLLAGPIARAEHLLPQICEPRSFCYDQATYGLKQMAWGFFKKIIIADTLAIYTDLVFGNIQSHTGFTLIAATVMFTFQIYCDFSGYSDIAIGCAKLFGIDLMNNFSVPYLSGSVKEFWSRWHISLSTWFRDYVYIPLGGNRCSKMRHYLNLVTTFAVSGLWHGASWTFVIWGILHGVGQVVENLFTKGKKLKSLKDRITVAALLRTGLVFCFCSAAWVFFKASSLQDALYVFTHALEGIASPVAYLSNGLTAMTLTKDRCIDIALMFLTLVAFDCFSLRTDVIRKIGKLPLVLRWAIYIVFLFLMLYLLPYKAGGEFIYFQF